MDTLPSIAIAGVGQSRVYLTGTDKRVFPPDINTKNIVKKIIFPFIMSAILRHDCKLSSAIYNAVKDELEELSLDENGHEKYNLTVERFTKSFKQSSEKERKFILRMLPANKIAEKIGEDNFYFFTYNSFGDTEKIIDELHEYILNVIKEKGTKKVNLVPVSLGGTVLTAYLTKYGQEKKVHRVVGVVPAFDGSSLAVKILEGDFRGCYNDILPKEIARFTRLLTEKTKGNVAESIIKAFVDKIFVNSPMAWGAVPHTDFVRLCEKFGLTGELKNTCYKFFEARNDFKEFVKTQKNNGVDIFSVCGCGLLMQEMLRLNECHSDGIVDTSSSSMGAYCPDVNGKIDVTTSAISDRVWFFEKMGHEESAKNEKLLTLVSILLKDDKIKSVNDDKNFPQFN